MLASRIYVNIKLCPFMKTTPCEMCVHTFATSKPCDDKLPTKKNSQHSGILFCTDDNVQCPQISHASMSLSFDSAMPYYLVMD